MTKTVLLLALMSVSSFHGTRSDYLLVKLDSQTENVRPKTPDTIPEVLEPIEASQNSTKLPITDAAKGIFAQYSKYFVRN